MPQLCLKVKLKRLYEMIRNIVFDIGRVLIEFEWFDYVGKLFSKETAEKVTAAMWGTGYWKQLDIALLTDDEILELFYSAGPEYRKEIREAFDRVGECVKRRDWAIPMIDDLKSRGYRVYYLSNFSEHVMGSNPDALDFVSHMDGGIFSCDVKVIKPASEIYTKLIEKYDLLPEECLFIDDHQDNVAAAKKCGMKAMRFESREQLEADLDKALTKDRGHDRISVLCYGDSNTYAYDPSTCGRYPYEKRWTTILGKMLGDRFEVISEGLNGRTTAYDRTGAPWKNGVSSFIATLATHKPVDYLVIMLGTNDCNTDLDLTAQQIAGGMETLVRLAEKEAPGIQGYIPEIIVTAPAAIRADYADSPFAYELTPEAVQKSAALGDLYREIAEKHMCRTVDATRAAEISDDCMHLSEKGHRQLAEMIYAEIKRDPASYNVEQDLVP